MPQDILRRDALLRAVDEKTRTASFVASTERIDRHGTKLLANWRLDDYARNPIVLRQHDCDRPIGTAEVRVEGKDLIAEVTFATGTTDADEAWKLVQQKVLRAMSVGFWPGRIAWVEPDGGEPFIEYDDIELWELSIVAVGSNADALARARGAEDQLREAAVARSKEKIMPNEAPASPPPATPPAAPADTISRAEHDRIIGQARATHEAAVAALQGSLADATAKLAASEARVAEAEKKVTASNEERIVRKVDALVGVKIPPAAKDRWLRMAQKDEDSFDALVDTLPEIVGARIVRDEIGHRATATDTDDEKKSKAFQEAFDKYLRAGKTRSEAAIAAAKEAA